MFKYTYRTRGFSIGCQPKDFIKFEQEEHKFETIYYDRELTKKEIEEYELIDLNSNNKRSYKVNIEEVLSRVVEIEAGTEEEALEIALDKYRNEEIILSDEDYIGSPEIQVVK